MRTPNLSIASVARLFSIALACFFWGTEATWAADKEALYAAPDLSSSGLDYATIKEVLLSTKPATYEAWLKQLTEHPKTKGLFAHPVFVHTSGSESTDLVTPDSPRILYTKDKLGLAVDNDNKSFQFMELDPKAGAIEPREIRFHPLEKPRFIDKPADCRSCHGEQVRTFWSSYKYWPHAYGGKEAMDYKKDRDPYNHFMETQKNRLPYSLLGLPKWRKDTVPYDPDHQFFSKLEKSLQQFTMVQAAWNAQLAQKAIEKLPNAASYRYALYGASLACDMESFFPDPAKTQRQLIELDKKIQEDLKSEYAHRKQLGFDSNINEAGILDLIPKKLKTITALELVLNRMGTTLKNWSFQHSPSIPPGYQFADGDQGIFTFAKRALAPFLADVEAEKDFTQGCRWLAEKSQAALSLITPKDPELASRILEREPSRTRNNPTH